VLADTHAPRRWRRCPPAVAQRLRGADLILHAGDVCTADVLDELAAYAPVRAVRGNNDIGAWARSLPAYDVVEIDSHKIYVLHNLSELHLDPDAAGFQNGGKRRGGYPLPQ